MIGNETHDDTTDLATPTTDRTFTPTEQRDARRLLADLRAWGQTLRDATPPSFIPLTAAERLTLHAWGQFAATATRLERLLGGERPETAETRDTDADADMTTSAGEATRSPGRVRREVTCE